mmetsp:Transcript_21991/g.33309  ORF Transcript_21991/g.33309 Transcript_21991/m.33309 type:complete len:195 (+) Transcript_21991:260-844(+)
MLRVANAAPAPALLAGRAATPAAAAATETAETFLIEILVKTAVVSGWVRLRMVHAVSPLSALGAATSTATKTRARTTAAHGITALVIAVWCAETLTITATCARGVDTVIGTVTAQTVAAVIATSSHVTTMTILAAASARTKPIMSAHGIATDALAAHSDSTLAKKSRKKNELFSKVLQGGEERHLLLDVLSPHM